MEYRGDVVIIGAGISGVCAALAAARHGAKVILAGDRPVVGGNSSSEIRMWTRGATGAGNLYSEEMGILGELKLRNLQTNPDGNVFFWDEVLLDALYAESNLTLLLNAHITDVRMEGERVTAVNGYQLGSERELCLYGSFFVDCTGDGTVAVKAGVPYHRGQEAAAEYGEESAPQEASAATMGSSIYYSVKRLDHDVPFIAPAYAYSMEEIQRIIDRGGRVVDETQSLSDYWWFEYGGLLDTIADAQEINHELKRLALGVWNYVKNSGKFNAGRLTLEWIGSFAGKRESRRMLADYMLTQHDVQNTRSFPDNAFYGGWYLDFHPSAGIYSDEHNCVQYPVQTYPIPLRTLFNHRRPNLLFAGRILGATHAAFASTRIMDTCAQSGQAAGTLAAMCAAHGLPPEQLAGPRVHEVQQALLRDDMLVIGAVNEDRADLARQAQITASSYLQALPNMPEGRFSLEHGAFVQLAVPAGAERCTLGLSGDMPRTVEVNAYFAPLPSRLAPGEWLGRLEFRYQPGRPTELALPSCGHNRFVTLLLPPTPGLWLDTVARAPLGFKAGAQWSMNHVYPAVSLPLESLYAPRQVLNGLNRAYGEPGLWISGPEKAPWLCLHWERPVTISQVIVYLNPDLSQELPSSFTGRWNDSHMLARPKSGRPWELAPSIELSVPDGGGWQTVASIHDNWQRRVVLSLTKPCSASALRLTFETADRAPEHYAQVFEVRVY